MTSNRLEDYTEADLRGEVERGARIVTYPYCISVIIITLRRRSRVYVIPAGHSTTTPGLSWALISLFFGWWGFPWGFIYTPVALFQTLGGGVDLTDEWRNAYDDRIRSEHAVRMAALQQKTPPPMPGQPQTGTPPAMPTSMPRPQTPPSLHAQPPAMPTSFHQDTQSAPRNNRQSGLVTAFKVLCALGVLLVLAYLGLGLLLMSGKQTVTLVNGLGKDYQVTFNNESYTCPAGGEKADPYVHLKLDKGTYEVRATLPNNQTFSDHILLGSSSIWNWPSRASRAIIVNPDKLALVYQETVVYTAYSVATTGKKKPNPVTFFLNQGVIDISKPDYYFVDSPNTIRIKSGDSSKRTQIDVVHTEDLQQALRYVRKYGSDEEFALYTAHASLLGSQLGTRALIDTVNQLAPVEAKKLFAGQLDTMPVNVQLHRYYQQYAEAKLPDVDLIAEYRARLEKDPDDGTLLYLYGRVQHDHIKAREYYKKSLASKNPCAYAWNGLAYEAMREGDKAKTLSCIEKAEASGIQTGMNDERINLLVAFGRLDEALKIANNDSNEEPGNIEIAARRLLLLGYAKISANDTTRTAVTFTDVTRDLLTFSSAASKTMEKDELADARLYLEASNAYGAGDEKRYVEILSKLKTWKALFINVALTKGDYAAAAKALDAIDNTGANRWFLASIVALMKSDTAKADDYFAKGVAQLEKGQPEQQQLAKLLSDKIAKSTLTAAHVCELIPMADDRRIICCVLGLRETRTQARAAFLRAAREADYALIFPHLLLQRALKGAAQN